MLYQLLYKNHRFFDQRGLGLELGQQQPTEKISKINLYYFLLELIQFALGHLFPLIVLAVCFAHQVMSTFEHKIAKKSKVEKFSLKI